MNPLIFKWRCTSCPRESRVPVETSEDVAPMCPVCSKVMKASDCCGVGLPERHRAEGLGDEAPPKVFHVPMEFIRRFAGAEIPEGLGGAVKVPDGMSPSEFLDSVLPIPSHYKLTHIDRRLDETERLVAELTSRLYPVVVGEVETEVVEDTSPMGERIERINTLLGRLLGGLDLP